jgi:hypothetical protein
MSHFPVTEGLGRRILCQHQLPCRPKGAPRPGECPLYRARELVSFLCFRRRSVRPTAKVGEDEGSTETAIADASKAPGVVPSAAAAGAAGALGLRSVYRDGAASTVVAAAADGATKALKGTLVRPGGAANGARDRRAGAAGLGGGGRTHGAAAAARDETGRDERSDFAARETAASSQSRACWPFL